MDDESSSTRKNDDLPASLRRPAKEPQKILYTRISLRHWEELVEFSHEYDQDVSTFIREAVEDWLRRARLARKADKPKPPDPLYPGVSE